VTPDSPNFATVEIVSENDGIERRKIPSILQTVANKCLTLTTSERLAAFTALSVEHNDVLFIGEVIRCTPGAADQWEISVKVAHTLTSLQSLMILRAELEQHQSLGKDPPIEEPIPCAVLKGKNKAAKNFRGH
jgi:hypothetical protein